MTVDPLAPPGRRSIERAGTVSLGYAGEVLRLEAADPAVRFHVYDPHTAFVVDDATPPTCVVSFAFGAVETPAGPPTFDAGGVWQLHEREGGHEEVCFFGRLEGGERHAIMRLDIDAGFGRVQATLRPFYEGDRVVRVGYPLDEYLLARLLGRRGGMVLHATTLLADGGAYVFCGHSGAGKSTMAEQAESAGAEVLSDDRTILTADGGELRAWGTPWHGTYRRGSPGSAPVRGVWLLVQAAEDRIVPIPAAQAFNELFVRLIQPSVAANEVEQTVDALVRLVGAVPVGELHFRPTPAAFLLARDSRRG